MRFDVTTFGELVIDLLPIETPLGRAYLPVPGGAPANVAAGVAQLGRTAAMISRVGMESFGEAAVRALARTGVDTGHITRSAENNTALAVVTLTEENESGFFFYRENCADSNLTVADVPDDIIASSTILHVGTLPLATPISAETQRHVVARARELGTIVTTDVNFRQAFWRDDGRMREAGLEVVRAAKIAKLSRHELAILSGIESMEAAVRSLWHDDLILVAVTKGAEGAELFTRSDAVSVPAFDVTVVDTVGCGDAVMANLLCSALECDFLFDRDDAESNGVARLRGGSRHGDPSRRPGEHA